jgi:uncharacterized protein YjiS (DUF1127 family)
MPTQPTNLTSDAGPEAAGLPFDVSIAFVEEAMDNVLATARPNVTIAALDGALQEKEGGPPAPPAQSVLSLLKGYWRWSFQEWYRRRRLRATLQNLSDRELMDIGVTRAEIDYIAAYRAFDELRNGTTYLWRSRGG